MILMDLTKISQINTQWDGPVAKTFKKFTKKIDSLDDGSKIVIVPPDYPYRCPPAQYER